MKLVEVGAHDFRCASTVQMCCCIERVACIHSLLLSNYDAILSSTASRQVCWYVNVTTQEFKNKKVGILFKRTILYTKK